MTLYETAGSAMLIEKRKTGGIEKRKTGGKENEQSV